MNRREDSAARQILYVIALVLILLVFSLFAPPAALAQDQSREPSLETRIANARDTFTELDNRAATCIAAFDAGSPADAQDARTDCADFMTAIDGSLVADYVNNCRVLKQWREDYITGAVADADSQAQTEQFLQRLRDIEYFCGEDALSRRTDNVQTAFNLIRRDQLGGRVRAGQLFNWIEFERALQELRNNSAISQRQQQLRLDAETESLWRDLELELIRQQLD